MSGKVQRPASPPPEKSATVSRRSAVRAALSLLAASMGVSLSDPAVAGKAKTADKAFNAMDGYVQGSQAPKTPKPTNPALNSNGILDGGGGWPTGGPAPTGTPTGGGTNSGAGRIR